MALKKSRIINNYLRQREIYLQNAEKFRDADRFRKASEMLWGAVSQTIKALAAATNIEIRKHGQFRKFIREVSIEIKDRELLTVFWNMEDLHRNFYDEEIPPEEFDIYMKLAGNYLSKLDELIAKKIKE